MGQAREAAERFYELFAEGDLDGAQKLFDPACITTGPTGAMNREEHIGLGHAFRAGFPDGHMVVEQVVESGDEVMLNGYFRGTQTGDLQSPGGTLPASGKPLNLRFSGYFKVDGAGLIVDQHEYFDQMELLGQLGALPPPA